jgi:hypothetical protein
MEKRSSKALPAILFVNPEVRDFAAASPRVAIDAGNDFACVASNGAGQELAVGIARCVDVELVDAVHQKRLDLWASGLVMEFDGSVLHGSEVLSECSRLRSLDRLNGREPPPLPLSAAGS